LVSITRIHGTADLRLSSHEAVVLCLVRDGDCYVDDFIEHYQSLGFAHIVFLDNGSMDCTVEKACAHDNVTVLRCTEDYKHQKLKMRWALMRLFGVGNWHLSVDIDEFFQYPFMDEVPLDEFIGYLNENAYTSVVAQQLDMVPPCPMRQLRRSPIPSIHDSAWYFDTSTVDKTEYNVPNNEVSNSRIKLWRGGIRRALFGTDTNVLTKHPLNFGDNKIVISSSHIVQNRRVADVSGLLLHYKFIGDVYGRVQAAVREGQYYRDSIEYRHYLNGFETRPEQGFLLPDSHRYEGHRQLLAQGLFEYTDSYHDAFS